MAGDDDRGGGRGKGASGPQGRSCSEKSDTRRTDGAQPDGQSPDAERETSEIMGFLLRAVLLAAGVFGAGGIYLLCTVLPVYLGAHLGPPALGNVYWGPGDEPASLPATVEPFKLVWDKQMISDLRGRLKNTRKLQPALEDAAWTYGMRSDFVSKIVDHWLNKYDFGKREAHLNRFPQFTTNIQGLNMHFIRVKPQLPKDRKVEVLPLLLLHGWPGSVVEFQKIIPMLTTPRPDRDFVFEVVAPSLPGYGFSDAAAKPGMGALEVALIMKNLMLRIGHDKFYLQGGDWGAVVTAYMSALFPQHVLGLHSNMCLNLDVRNLAKIWAYSLVPWLLPKDERTMLYPLKDVVAELLEESGYFHEQATKPDTLGVGITDSPAGLAAYIIEKFSMGSDMKNKYLDDGNVLQTFSADELIDNLMFYWVPNKATSAVRLYAESFNKRELSYRMDSVPIKVPSACAVFPHEILRFPAEFLRNRFVNMVHYHKPPRGGHFAAMQVPKLLADDVFLGVHKMRQHHAKTLEKLEF